MATNNYEKGRCPECNSENIHYGVLDISDSVDTIMYPCMCEDCGCTFTEYYTITFLEILKN